MSAAPPKLAVVISNFNYARFLPETLGSVLEQTIPFDEIVVVDDGSSDNSLEILSSYAGRVQVVAISNRGQTGACQAGLAATHSDYIYFLDADDYASRDLVANIRPALMDRPAKIQFQLHSVDSAGTQIGSVFPTYPAAYDAAAMREDNATLGFYLCPTTSGNVFSRWALERLPLQSFDPRGAFDGSPALAMPYLGAIKSINQPLAYYRVHEGSLSGWGNPTSELLKRELQIFEKTWVEILTALDLTSPPFVTYGPLYVIERQLMMACFVNKIFVGRLVWRYLVIIPHTRLSSKQKILLTVWAMALLVPSSRLRRSVIHSKRSAANRSRYLRAIVKFITGGRFIRRVQ